MSGFSSLQPATHAIKRTERTIAVILFVFSLSFLQTEFYRGFPIVFFKSIGKIKAITITCHKSSFRHAVSRGEKLLCLMHSLFYQILLLFLNLFSLGVKWRNGETHGGNLACAKTPTQNNLASWESDILGPRLWRHTRIQNFSQAVSFLSNSSSCHHADPPGV